MTCVNEAPISAEIQKGCNDGPRSDGVTNWGWIGTSALHLKRESPRNFGGSCGVPPATHGGPRRVPEDPSDCDLRASDLGGQARVWRDGLLQCRVPQSKKPSIPLRAFPCGVDDPAFGGTACGGTASCVTESALASESMLRCVPDSSIP
jgi:hypothetical protein